MNKTSRFGGYPEAGFQFLAGLAENNNKAWFEAHKEAYQRDLLEPSLAFVETIGAQLQTIVPELRMDTRTNGRGNLMRIHRDTRFSQDKTPYKTAVSALFWQGDGKKTECPAFGFQVDRQGMQLMAGLFAFSKEQLQQYRQAVVDDKWGKALVTAATTVTQSGSYQLKGQHYKKTPQGYDPTHERAEWLLYNGLYAHPQHSIALAQVCSPAIVDICLAHFQNMAPVQQWLVQVLG
ncbi:MAG: DUF2461 domain-containing protein [Anaerolineaceae bacterium]|nr:DUF2461 domain-containing protein [Anaerolineaceae bacterium]